jgi:hypothetical protein
MGVLFGGFDGAMAVSGGSVPDDMRALRFVVEDAASGMGGSFDVNHLPEPHFTPTTNCLQRPTASMTDALNARENWAAPLLRQLQPEARNKAARNLAQQLRRRYQLRNLDGTTLVPGKQRNLRGKQGRTRRKVTTLRKLRTAWYLKAKGNEGASAWGLRGVLPG